MNSNTFPQISVYMHLQNLGKSFVCIRSSHGSYFVLYSPACWNLRSVVCLEVRRCGEVDLEEDQKSLVTNVLQGRLLKFLQAKIDHLFRQGGNSAPTGKGGLAKF